MIPLGNFKFVHAPGDPDQLFNLSNDPQELTNLADSLVHSEMVAALRQEIADQVHEDVLWSQRRRRLVARSLMKGKITSWDFQPMVDASQQ